MIPRGRDNLRRHPFDHLRQRTPTTSTSTRRTRTCDWAAAPAFLSTAADAATDPPPHSSPVPPCYRRADAGRQARREHLPCPALRASQESAGSCTITPTTGRAAATARGSVRSALCTLKTKPCRQRPQPVRMYSDVLHSGSGSRRGFACLHPHSGGDS
jgi:hypothetical protein